MANEIHQHPNGDIIIIRGDRATYTDTLANFENDFNTKLPMLPKGADEHIYTQGKRHCFMGDGNIIDGGPVPWPEGDAIIADVDRAISAQNQRLVVEQEKRDAELATTREQLTS